MLTVKVHDEIINIPESIDDISIGRFIKLRNININNPLQLFEWTIGKSVKLSASKESQQQVANVLTLIEPVLNEVFDFMASGENLLPPDKVTVLGLDIKITKSMIQSLPYWAAIRCKDIVQERSKTEPFDATDNIPEIIAHYLYEPVTKSVYNEKKADEFIEVINDMPMIDAIKLGNFFLLQQLRLFKNKQTSCLIRLMLMKQKLVSKYSPSMVKLTRWRR